ncbi:NACHT domain-containing protein [Alteromonas sp. a30]|uniref:NACHT domain-containing protein n=1 Tax=Alteromonas sp. a30 TaxID=2730917 RepID=UPI00227F7D44|nr:leucine-rich repeat domain-containing protein [Alteromonas sp. a30]MCY7296274.1 NACHT domain-containing protein [Alteromonas sp. a30]
MTTAKLPLPKFELPDDKTFIDLFDSDLFYYLNSLQTDNRYLDNQGLAMDDQEYTGSSNKVSLDSLYIFPAASKERIDPDDMVKQNKKQELDFLLRLPTVIADNPRVTLLGDPGIGKSTFIQWLTLSLSSQSENAGKNWFNHLLPVVITARKLRKPTNDTSSEYFLKMICSSMGTAGALLEESSDTFQHCLSTGQAIVLVDGVDEIGVDTSRWLSASLKQFFSDYPKVRLILTARVVGFDSQEFWHPKTPEEREKEHEKKHEKELKEALKALEDISSKVGYSKLPDEPVYPHFYLAPFDTERRAQYVDNWTRLYLPKKTESESFANTLRTTCQDAHYLDALSRNPVLLTMICFIQWRVGQLPNGRAELYQRIIATYLVALDRARKTEVGFTADNMEYHFDDIKLWLGKLAWQMQCANLLSLNLENADADPVYPHDENSIGFIFGTRRDTTIYQSDLTRFFAVQLAQVICSEEELDEVESTEDPDSLPASAVKEAEKLIDFLKKRTGFLIPKGIGQKSEDAPPEDFFSFSHLSFQEYFAGYYLSENWPEWAKEDETIKLLQNSILDENWIEVWQLAFEESSRKQQSDMLKQLFEHSRKFISLQDEHLLLQAKVVMNPTIKLKLKDRQKHIKTLWEKVAGRELNFVFLTSSSDQIINTLWKTSFGSLDILIAQSPKALSLSGIFTQDKAEVLNQLTALEELDISDSQIHALPHLSHLQQLRRLKANDAELLNINNLQALNQLEILDLGGNPIESFSPLASLTRLKTLSINYIDWIDCRDIAGLTQLEELMCEHNTILHCEYLGKLTNLKTLSLEGATLTSTEVLTQLINLERLDLSFCSIAELPSLSNLLSLKRFNIHSNDLTDLSALASSTSLEYLDLEDNEISDLRPLTGLKNLTWLYLRSNPITDLSPLVHCQNLKRLFLDEEQLERLDTSVLTQHLTELEIVDRDEIPF